MNDGTGVNLHTVVRRQHTMLHPAEVALLLVQNDIVQKQEPEKEAQQQGADAGEETPSITTTNYSKLYNTPRQPTTSRFIPGFHDNTQLYIPDLAVSPRIRSRRWHSASRSTNLMDRHAPTHHSESLKKKKHKKKKSSSRKTCKGAKSDNKEKPEERFSVHNLGMLLDELGRSSLSHQSSVDSSRRSSMSGRSAYSTPTCIQGRERSQSSGRRVRFCLPLSDSAINYQPSIREALLAPRPRNHVLQVEFGDRSRLSSFRESPNTTRTPGFNNNKNNNKNNSKIGDGSANPTEKMTPLGLKEFFTKRADSIQTLIDQEMCSLKSELSVDRRSKSKHR